MHNLHYAYFDNNKIASLNQPFDYAANLKVVYLNNNQIKSLVSVHHTVNCIILRVAIWLTSCHDTACHDTDMASSHCFLSAA